MENVNKPRILRANGDHIKERLKYSNFGKQKRVLYKSRKKCYVAKTTLIKHYNTLLRMRYYIYYSPLRIYKVKVTNKS